MLRRLFLDVDGVAADFDIVVEEILGMPGRVFETKYGQECLWNTLHEQDPNLFLHLPLMEDFLELWEFAKHFKPIFLTGCSQDWGIPQKLAWRDKMFPGTPMIVCRSADKCKHGSAGDILVDDYLKYKDLWTNMGGIFVHHTSAASSIESLASLFNT